MKTINNSFYIINANEPFRGIIQNSMRNYPYVDFTEGETWLNYKYKKEKEDPTIKLVLITADKLQPMLDAYHNSLISEWSNITEERYWDALECLPPVNWRDIYEGINVFFISEAYTDNIHSAFIKAKNGKETLYYSATRRLNESNQSLLDSFLNSILKPSK